jgi:hypothetical protein
MFFISHRGNLFGSKPKLENSPDYIMNALEQGYEVEVDVRFYKNNFYLGHDEPQFKISKNFLINKKIWCHAKNYLALEMLKKIKTTFFWHQNDDYTLTSNGYFWTYPNKKMLKNSICVILEKKKLKNINCAGICSDYISSYKND